MTARFGDEYALPLVEATIAGARDRLGSRLRSVYVIGSLAHGGFSPLVSDVDVALVLADPLQRVRDRLEVSSLRRALANRGLPLAPRLSVFWGSVSSLNHGRHGRFPAADRLDLVTHGQRRFGQAVKERVSPPSIDMLVVDGARFTLNAWGAKQRARELHTPALLASRGPRVVTKAVLSPVRLLYTLATGSVSANEEAARHYLAAAPGVQEAELVARALQWRSAWTAADEHDAAALVAAGLAPLYREFAAAYSARLRAISRDRLASSLVAFVSTL